MKAPDTILSTYNHLWMAFVTDGSIENRGFQLNYTTMEVGRMAATLPHLEQVCSGSGGILRDMAGVISSPRRPLEYPHGVDCRY